MLKILPITDEYFLHLYNHRPPYTVRGWAGLRGNEPVAVAGLCYFPSQVIAFCKIIPEAESEKYSIAKGTLKVLELIKKVKGPVYAVAEPENHSAENFLVRCGFEYLDKGPNGEVFVCRH